MGREIKFRAWDNIHKRFWYEFGEGQAEVKNVGVNETIRRYQNDDNWVIQQFTGLRDKNGKDIYEGDLVRKDTYSEGYCLPIVWMDCMFQLGKSGISPLYNETRYEVIGNIYETPELLK